VIPGIVAVGSFSPLLNEEGNCVRGIGMIDKLNEIYINFNLFYKDSKKKDLMRRAHQTLVWTVISGINAAASGDIESISRLIVKGLNINDTDYDSRTPLHLAAQAGHVELV
jgi:glutaminase